MKIHASEEKELKNYIPSVGIDTDYNLVTLNETAKRMFGSVVGRKCYKVLYAFDEPCYRMGMRCPVYDGITDIDIISVNYENYIRSYGFKQEEGIYWESIINITSVELLRSSMIDSLSTLYNRKFAETYLEKSFKLWERYRQPFGLMFVDIDNFKRINDEYGHLTGDRVIQRIGSYLKGVLRSSDIACRYGGDEFLIILPNSGISACKSAALRVFGNPEKFQLPFPVSVSVGLAHSTEGDKSYHDIIRRADKAMYEAKKSGKGKIAVAESEEDIYLME